MLKFESEEELHDFLSWAMVACAPLVFILLRYIYKGGWGKTHSTLLGPSLPPRLSWFLFEVPNLYWASYCYFSLESKLPLANTVLLSLFVCHYINRSIVYPLTLNKYSKDIPLEIVLSGFSYTNWNGYIQSRALCQFQTYPDDYLSHPRFWLGVALWAFGLFINWQSDDILRNLRKDKPKVVDDGDKSGNNNNNKSHYVIPNGGFFEYVSAPHYFGEMVEWTGFALAARTTAAWAFCIFTASNLIPRGLNHHDWYVSKFEDYPPHRKAVIPFVW